MSSDKVESAGSIFTRGTRYIGESVDELKKISTPTRQETMQATLATIAIIVFFALCLLVFDFLCNWVMSLLT